MGKPDAKKRILTTASDLFHRRGYSEVGINEIIEKSETAKATFYHHFPSKEALCEAWLAEIHERSEEARQTVLRDSAPAIEKITNYFEHLRRYLEASNFRGCPYSNTAVVATQSEQSLACQVEVHKVCTREFFKDVVGEICATADRAREIGDALFLLYSGATTEAQNLKAIWPVEVALRTAEEWCLREAKK